MRVIFQVVDRLPDDAAAGIMTGQDETFVYLADGWTTLSIAAALQDVLGDWLGAEWLHIGSSSLTGSGDASG